MLSDSESDDDLHQLTINEHYEKAFYAKKEREELAKLKDELGSDASENDDEEEDSESDETEDEIGEELTPATDVAILRTLAKIKNKDPSIYEKNANVFDEEQARGPTLAPTSRSKQKESKPIRMKDHVLKSILASTSRSPSPEPTPLTHNEEQAVLRSETISAFHGAVKAGNDEAEDDLLVPREKTKDEIERDEEEYAEFLRREVGEDLDKLVDVEEDEASQEEASDVVTSRKEEKGKKKKKSKSTTDHSQKEKEDHEFLMNYILNRGWIDKSQGRVPKYSDITNGVSADHGPEDDGDNYQLHEDDDEFEEIAEDFETSYNFRFEEPNADIIQRFPRTIPSATRRVDTTRIEARQRRKERKEEEKLRRKEEVKRMKALKLKEQREKLDRIAKEGGIKVDEEDFEKIDLDGDWDPDEHDQQMAGLYDEAKIQSDDKKPVWDDDIDIDDIVPPAPRTSKKSGKVTEAEQMEDFNATYEEDDEEWDGTEDSRKQKLDAYMEELYKMEFEDLAGDMPTRFNYVPVASDSFSLTPTEMLMADDKDLNEYVGLKKLAPYRKQKSWDKKRVERLKEFKEKMKMRNRMWWGNTSGEQTDGKEKTKPKRAGRKERRKLKVSESGAVSEGV